MGVFSSLYRLITPREKLGNHFIYSLSSLKDIYETDALKAFEEVPEVNAVINRDAAMFSNMKIKVVDKNGEEIQDKEVEDLIKRPNWYQAQKEFVRQTRILRNVYGNEFIYFFRPTGLRKIKSLNTIPSNLIKVRYKSNTPYFDHLERPDELIYEVNINGRYQVIEDILHLNDNNISIDKVNDESFFVGQSKLKALAAPINNIRDAYESRGVIIRKRGALGILTNGSKDGIGSSMPIDGNEKEELQKEYKGYGTLKNQDQLIITNLDLKWQQMAQNEPKKLGLFEEVKEDFMKLIDAYGHPLELYASVTGATFENQEQAIKNVYVNSIIPAANEWISAISKEIYGDDDNRNIVAAYDHLPIFQEDLNEKSEQFSKTVTALTMAMQNEGITLDEYKEQLQIFMS